MVLMGCICVFIALLYFFFTVDTPTGNFKELRAKGEVIPQRKDTGKFIDALLDYRVIILFFVYAGCFGIELTIYGCMDDYLQNKFGLERHIAGYIVLLFAFMNIFARTLGGFFWRFMGKKRNRRKSPFFSIYYGIRRDAFGIIFSDRYPLYSNNNFSFI